MKEKEKIKIALSKYLPNGFEGMVADLIFSAPLKFKIVKPRKTKLGDFRPAFNGKPHQITVNGNLNPYAFLITTLHEFAHLQTHLTYGNTVAPHGKEWKKAFSILLAPLLISETIPEDIKNALKYTISNIRAATYTDIELSRTLKRYNKDSEKSNTLLLEEIDCDQAFKIDGRLFQRGQLKRKRYLCKEVNTGKFYLINRLAEVELIDKNV